MMMMMMRMEKITVVWGLHATRHVRARSSCSMGAGGGDASAPLAVGGGRAAPPQQQQPALTGDVLQAASHPSLGGVDKGARILWAAESYATTVLVPAACASVSESLPALLVAAGWAQPGSALAVAVAGGALAAASAARLADATRARLGREVGYATSYERALDPAAARVAYFAEGALLRGMAADPLLRGYSAVLVDAGRERSTAADALLALLRKVQRRRRDLRVLVVAAPHHAATLAAHFDLRVTGSKSKAAAQPLPPHAGTEPPAENMCAAIVCLEVEPHPVRVSFSATPVADYMSAAAEVILRLHATEPVPGDVLVLVPTAAAVQECAAALEEEIARGRADQSRARLRVCRLHGAMAAAAQAEALRLAAPGMRKVVVAAGAGEDVAIEGVAFVVDSGLQLETLHGVDDGVVRHVVTPISQARAERRAALAGASRPGQAARLYTEQAYAALAADCVVEAQRCDLSSVVLRLKALGVENVARFDWPSAPPAALVGTALEMLFALGALDDASRLTPLGERMAHMPCASPMLAKALAVAPEMGCVEEMAAVAGCLSVRSLWYGGAKADELEDSLAVFATAEGDMITYLNVMTAYARAGRRAQWCVQYSLDARALAAAEAARACSLAAVRHAAAGSSAAPAAAQNGAAEASAVCRALAAGFFPHAATRETDSEGWSRSGRDVYVTARARTRVSLHKRCALSLSSKAAPYVVCAEMVEDEEGSVIMRHVCRVTDAWLKEAARDFFLDETRPEEQAVDYLAKRQKNARSRFARRGL